MIIFSCWRGRIKNNRLCQHTYLPNQYIAAKASTGRRLSNHSFLEDTSLFFLSLKLGIIFLAVQRPPLVPGFRKNVRLIGGG